MERDLINWQDAAIYDPDGGQPDLKTRIEKLREYRMRGTMDGYFFTDSNDEDAWEVAPEIDWTGFPEPLSLEVTVEFDSGHYCVVLYDDDAADDDEYWVDITGRVNPYYSDDEIAAIIIDGQRVEFDADGAWQVALDAAIARARAAASPENGDEAGE